MHVRLLGHVPNGPETPDGDRCDPDDRPVPGGAASRHRPGRCRSSTETGHVTSSSTRSRAGEPAPGLVPRPAGAGRRCPAPAAPGRPAAAGAPRRPAAPGRAGRPGGPRLRGGVRRSAGCWHCPSRPWSAALARWRQDAARRGPGAAGRRADAGRHAGRRLPATWPVGRTCSPRTSRTAGGRARSAPRASAGDRRGARHPTGRPRWARPAADRRPVGGGGRHGAAAARPERRRDGRARAAESPADDPGRLLAELAPVPVRAGGAGPVAGPARPARRAGGQGDGARRDRGQGRTSRRAPQLAAAPAQPPRDALDELLDRATRGVAEGGAP